jgi:hypothetical protein
MSLETLELLANWVKKGYPVYFLEHLPLQINTFHASEDQLARWKNAKESMLLQVFSDPTDILAKRGVTREKIADQGLSFIRKKSELGYTYFLTNLSNQFQEGIISLAKIGTDFEISDPLTGQKTVKHVPKLSAFFLQLNPGQSAFIRSLPAKKRASSETVPAQAVETALVPVTPIRVQFTKGAPSIPLPLSLATLTYWTQDPSTHDFWGTGNYRFSFSLAADQIAACRILHFDKIRDWARVKINGKDLGIVWSLPYQIQIPAGVLKEENTIEIAVTNVSANRIRKLDRDKVVWKNFYEINFVDINYVPFDASKWAVTESGLQGKLFFTNR